jgi:hypothetical protein
MSLMPAVYYFGSKNQNRLKEWHGVARRLAKAGMTSERSERFLLRTIMTITQRALVR